MTVLGVFSDSPIGLIRNDEILNSAGNFSNNKISSWLNGDYSWTMTYYTNTSNKAWRVNGDKFLNSNANSSNTFVRPVIFLSSSVSILGGSGTEEDPFIVQ